MAVRTLGEYSITRLVGRGGMGEVWEGYDPDLDRRVAIKVILPHLSTEPTFHDRLRGEARLVAALRHQNIVQLYDFDMVDGQAIMVMEYLAGGSLRDRLVRLRDAGQQLPLTAAANLLNAVASGLDYAHARGAVHRDLKPGNILFSPEDVPIISDFGIAKIVNASSPLTTPTNSEPGSILGTPAYMSPEQAAGGEIDHRSDLYSLGIVLYELVTGRVPFSGDSPAAILTQQIHHDPPSPRTLNPNISAAVEEVLVQALAKDPNARFARAAEMMQALRSADHLQSLAAEPSASAFENARQADAVDLPHVESPPTNTSPAIPSAAQESPTIVEQPDAPTIINYRRDDPDQTERATPGDAV
jgi:serine/threonine-protein kinase